jgi:hypothetical protein
LALAVGLVVTPGLVAAKGGHGGGGQGDNSFNLQGTILSFECGDSGYVNVDQVTPSYYGDQVIVQITGDTRFRQCDQDGNMTRIVCAQLVDGYEVRAIGIVDDGAYVARRVIQYIP